MHHIEESRAAVRMIGAIIGGDLNSPHDCRKKLKPGS